jgi:hypothetical protein
MRTEDRETRKKLADMFQKVEKWQEVEKILQESRDHVQWDGEKFVPKPMQLSPIWPNFVIPQSFQDRDVRVRYTTAELSSAIKMMEHAVLTITPTSCEDLQRMGHKLSGFYSVKGSKKMETVYCEFYPNQNGTACFSFNCHCLI